MHSGENLNMAKKRKPLVDEILKVHEKMRDMLLKSDISETRIKRPIDKMNKKDYNNIRKLRTWINRIHDNEFAALMKVWGLLPESKWKWYLDMEIYDLEEQRLLREAKRKLDEAWGHKPKRKKGAKRRTRKKTNSAS